MLMSAAEEALNVVLVEPEIPQNTGNIARLCGATNSVLHLVHPLGFHINDKYLKRAGLDYWPHVQLREHKSLSAFMAYAAGKEKIYFSTKGEKIYTEAPYKPGLFLIFGKETAGLPAAVLNKNRYKTYKLPIWGQVRSLNLATTVGIVVYEACSRILGWQR